MENGSVYSDTALPEVGGFFNRFLLSTVKKIVKAASARVEAAKTYM